MERRHKVIVLIFFLFTVAVSTLMHLEHFPKDLVSIHVWRQTQTQSNIDNFYEEDMNILNPRRNDRGDGDGIFRMEFPLMQWSVALLYHIFGQSILVTRLFVFFCGIMAMAGIYLFLKNLLNDRVSALAGAWAMTFSPSFYYHSINPMPDVMALALGIWGLAMFARYTRSPRRSDLLLSSFLLALATLVKLPFVLFYAFPVGWFMFVNRNSEPALRRLKTVVVYCLLLIFPLAWYSWVIPGWNGNPVVKGILQDSEANRRWLEYMINLLVSTFPELILNYGSLLFFFSGFYFLYRKKPWRSRYIKPLFLMAVALAAYGIYEGSLFGKIHDYYLFLYFPLLFLTVGFGAGKLFRSGRTAKIIALILLAILPVTCWLRMEVRWDTDSPGFNRDLLVFKEELRNAVPSTDLVVAGNDVSHYIFFYYIDKKGWAFEQDWITPEQLKEMINKGARWLYTDSDRVKSGKEFQSIIGEPVKQFGSVSIYKLQ
ncbi:MAG: hypothetical protein Kow00127_03690 [Bacteroidales bacterium]